MYFCWDACLLGWWHIKKNTSKDKHTRFLYYVTLQNLDVGIVDVEKLLFMMLIQWLLCRCNYVVNKLPVSVVLNLRICYVTSSGCINRGAEYCDYQVFGK